MNKTLFFFFLLFLSLAATAQKDGIPERPHPPRLVNDFADILTQSEEAALELRLAAFADSTSNQIAVVTVNDLAGYDPAEFTYTLGERWGVGQKGFDNGVVIMVKPRGGPGERHTFIAPGYGLEGVLPDAVCKQIIEEMMIPAFRQEDFYGGILGAVVVIEKLAAGEITVADLQKQRSPFADKDLVVGLLVPFLLFLLFFGFRLKRARDYAHTNDTSILWALLMMNSVGRHSGSWSDFRSGGGSFGGGGGFGGFGGGSFGGGGAGGSW